MKIKNRSYRSEINRPRSRHEHKYSKDKKCLNMIILLCIKQHLSNIWNSIHEKGKAELKKALLIKKTCSLSFKRAFMDNITYIGYLPNSVAT